MTRIARILFAGALAIGAVLSNGGAVFAAFIGNALARKLTGHFDYVGHNVEIMVEERAGFPDYRAGEITRMIERGDQRGMTADQVDAALRRWAWLARVALALFKGRFA